MDKSDIQMVNFVRFSNGGVIKHIKPIAISQNITSTFTFLFIYYALVGVSVGRNKCRHLCYGRNKAEFGESTIGETTIGEKT